MYSINRRNRENIETEFLSLLLHKNELIDLIQVLPTYLLVEQNKKILEYAIECYKEHGITKIEEMYKKHKDLDMHYLTEVLDDTMWYNVAWKKQLEYSEKSIVKFYKEDLIKKLNKQLENGLISYDEFLDKTKKIDDTVLLNDSPLLTVRELEENIDDNKIAIKLKNYSKLNSMLNFVQNDFLIIGATTGAGKSGLMLNFMNSLMEKYQCIYFNMEMSKSTIYKRLIAIEAEVMIDHILNPTEHEKGRIERAKEKIEASKLIIEHQANDIKQIKSILAKQKDKERHTILFIDHLGLCRCDNTKSLYEQATEVAKQLRQICFEYDCTVISASQLNRGAYNSDDISLSMLKDSGELENSASKVILLYRDKGCSKEKEVVDMNIEIAKNRDGICGVLKTKYDKPRQLFREIIDYDYRS